MRIKYSISYLIIIIISLVAMGTLCFGYFLNLDTLKDVIEARERDRSQSIQYFVNDKINHYIKDMEGYSHFLKDNPQLMAALSQDRIQGDKKLLSQTMDFLAPPLTNLGIDLCLVTNEQGNILYRNSDRINQDNLFQIWGMEEALGGQEILTAGGGPLGWSILNLIPLSRGGKQYGLLILSLPLNDEFAKRIAAGTQTQISFASANQILASSWPTAQRQYIKLTRITESISEKTSFFVINTHSHINSFYMPMEIVDETICLIISMDASPILRLLQEKKKHLLLSLILVFILTIGIGSGLAVTIVKPLKKLQDRTREAIKEFSQQQDISLPRTGSEIETLSQAVELMLSAIRLHLRELHQAQETIRKEKQLLDDVFTSIQDGLCVLDRNLAIVRVNPALQQHSLQAESLMGQSCYKTFYDQVQPCDNCPGRQAMEQGKSMYQSMPVLVHDTKKWVEVHAYPLRDQESGEVYGVIEYIRDVTEIKATEEALRKKEEQLRQAAKMEAVGRLAGGIAHDFNNILMVILGECELLLDHLPQEDVNRPKISLVMEAAQQAASLTQQLLAFSRKQILQPMPLDLNAVVMRMDQMLQRILGEDIHLVTKLAPALGTIKVDHVQLEQVILNLATNAREAMPRGGSLTLETTNVDLDEHYTQNRPDVCPGPYVMLAVTDTGVGLEKEIAPQIFDPFFTSKEKGHGAGLGLSIIYGIIKQSQGHIAVYSEIGRGTTFKIYLPRYDLPSETIPKSLPLAGKLTQATETIMVVEDEEAVRNVVERLLEKSGYRVLSAADPEEALDMFKEFPEPIDMLLTDVVMPGMGGRELAERILAQDKGIKVLFMSGYTENAIIHHGVLDPDIAFINKPFSFKELISKVREVLEADYPCQP